MKKKAKQQKGFSLVEMIMYVGVVAVVFVVVVNMTLSVASIWNNARVKRNIITQGGSALERILYELRLANSVDAAGSVFGVSPGTVKVNTIVSPDDATPTTREFFADASALKLRENGTDTFLITDVTITNLIFYRIENADTSEAVRVVLTIEDGNRTSKQTQTFYGAAVLRGSY
ncbi:MAG: prepilin-type N-terminal cleavage/methylation domain-containing protein [bacterium]|nr:prepilin-type N-terminal cleavage/methylation domain-containing protein [bacterium]